MVSRDMPMPLSEIVSVPACLVRDQLDLPVGVVLEQLRLRQTLEADAVDGVASVADQLAQEDVLVRVKRVNDQVQELLELRLELHGFAWHTHSS